MNTPLSRVTSRPLTGNALAKTYTLVLVALLVTLFGVGLGATILLPFVTGPAMLVLFIAEIALIFTSQLWSRIPGWNITLFLLFPFLSGLTLTPILFFYASTYVNGMSIIVNALIACSFLVASSAVISGMVRTDLWGTFGLFLMQGLIGLILFSLLQMFFPSLRGTVIDTVVSATGIVLFSVFLAADLQRIRRMGGMDPFQMALSVYLDIFNLFLYVLRFMGVMSRD
ncbi:MAG: Bax inhibitor-1 family protein [Candidatus Peribacteraceae bacterium]